jgi:hypothetical protein
MFTKARIYYIIILVMITNLEFLIYYEKDRDDMSARTNAMHTRNTMGQHEIK